MGGDMLVVDGPEIGHEPPEHGRVAMWSVGRLKLFPEYGLSPEEADQLQEFIAAGLPQPKWRITRTFDRRPEQVVTGGTGFGAHHLVLEDNDLEKEWP